MTRQKIRVTRGLNVPIDGTAADDRVDRVEVTRVALLGSDYRGLKPAMAVSEGDRVSLGQPLFADKKNPGVQFTAPGAGKVVEMGKRIRAVFPALGEAAGFGVLLPFRGFERSL